MALIEQGKLCDCFTDNFCGMELITLDDALELIEGAPTIDPIKAAGGCYCGECCFGRKPNSADMQDGYVYCQQQSKYKELDAFCSDGEPREAPDDG